MCQRVWELTDLAHLPFHTGANKQQAVSWGNCRAGGKEGFLCVSKYDSEEPREHLTAALVSLLVTD